MKLKTVAFTALASMLFAPVLVQSGTAQAALDCPPGAVTWWSSDQFGNDGWQNQFIVNNDEWGSGHGSEVIWHSPASFGVCAIDQPVTSPNNVKAYPNAGEDLPGNTWSSYTTIKGTFDMTNSVIPGNGEQLQMLWDVWLNGLAGSSNPTEIGIAPYRHNEGPAYGTFLGNASLNGRNYGVYDASAPGGHTYYVFNATSNEQSGTIGIRSALSWLQSHGKVANSDKLENISGGWEITNSPTSGSIPLTLEMGNFSVTTN